MQHDCYIPYINRGSQNAFLDIGCGAGEFLKVLAEHKIAAKGIDINKSEVARAQERGLIVTQGEAIDFLNTSNETFSGISLLEVIEHLPPERIKPLIKAAVDKLEPGGLLLIETVNMRHPSALNGFYFDPTHVRPVPEDYLAFLMQWY